METDIKINLYMEVARHMHKVTPALCMANYTVLVPDYFESLNLYS